MNLSKYGLAVMLFVTVFGVGSAFAECSNATLHGTYGQLLTGWISGNTGAAFGADTFDGNGNVSGTQTWSTLLGASTFPFAGTYTVAKDCTGSLYAGGQTFNFVLDNDHQGAQVIWANTGWVYTGNVVAQGDVDSLTDDESHTCAANLIGTVAGVGYVAVVGKLDLDGKGNISGSGTFSVNGAISSGSITGTYTETSGGLGTVQITPQGLGRMNFNTIVVDGGKKLLLTETDTGAVITGTFTK